MGHGDPACGNRDRAAWTCAARKPLARRASPVPWCLRGLQRRALGLRGRRRSRSRRADFGAEWWRLYAEPNLAPTALRVYAMLWGQPRAAAARLRSAARADAGGHQPLPARARERPRRARLDRQFADAAAGPAAAPLRLGAAWVEPCAPSPQAANDTDPDGHATAARNGRARLLRGDLPRDGTLVSVLAYAGAAAGRGAGAELGPPARAHAADRGGGQPRRARRNQDAPSPQRAPSRAAGPRPRGVADDRPTAARRHRSL